MIMRLIFCVLFGFAGLAVSADSTDSLPTVVQGRPLFPDLRKPSFSGIDSKSIYPSMTGDYRGAIGKKLESWGLLFPKRAFTLKIQDANGRATEKVLWKFSEDYYLPEGEISSSEVKIIAWHNFLVTAEVTFQNGDSETHTKLVKLN